MRFISNEKWAVTACVLALHAACRWRPGDQIEVRITSARPPALSLSNYWHFGSDRLESVASDGTDYRTVIPANHLPLPFLDLNRNGRLDFGREPVARCRRSENWLCQILPARLIVHRTQGIGDDSTVVFGEAFDPKSYHMDSSAVLCDVDASRCVRESMPAHYFNSAPLLAIKICDIGKSTVRKDYGIELRSSSNVLLRSRIRQPPAMNLKTRLSVRSDGYVLTGETSLPLTRAVVWLAEMRGREIKHVQWSSEQEPDLFALNRRDFEMHMPERVIRSCPGCFLGVQAVSDIEVGPVTISSEGAALLSIPRRGL
jgi:hypothetical protein